MGVADTGIYVNWITYVRMNRRTCMSYVRICACVSRSRRGWGWSTACLRPPWRDLMQPVKEKMRSTSVHNRSNCNPLVWGGLEHPVETSARWVSCQWIRLSIQRESSWLQEQLRTPYVVEIKLLECCRITQKHTTAYHMSYTNFDHTVMYVTKQHNVIYNYCWLR